MSVEFKGGVNFDVIPQIRQAVSRIETIFSRYRYIPVITSARDSTHEVGSLHYIGAAIDFRSKGLPENIKQSIFRDLQSAFPVPTWWVDLENFGGALEHFHLEYKPAKRADIDPYSVDPADLMTTFLPTDQQSQDDMNAWFPQPSPPIETPYPQYPTGTIPPQYFTPYEQSPGWLMIIGIIIAGWIFLELTE